MNRQIKHEQDLDIRIGEGAEGIRVSITREDKRGMWVRVG